MQWNSVFRLLNNIVSRRLCIPAQNFAFSRSALQLNSYLSIAEVSKFAVIKGLKKRKILPAKRYRDSDTRHIAVSMEGIPVVQRVYNAFLCFFFFFLFLRTDDGHACTMVEGKQVGRERKLCGQTVWIVEGEGENRGWVWHALNLPATGGELFHCRIPESGSRKGGGGSLLLSGLPPGIVDEVGIYICVCVNTYISPRLASRLGF